MVDIVTPDRVGYSPVPNARPELQPTRPIFLNTQLASFGGERAKALGLLGSTLDKASDELGTRALAMQELNNQATARQATYGAMTKANQLWEDFRSKQGSEAGPDAFNAYQKSVNDTFDQGGSGLNPQAANYYYNNSSFARERLSIMGASHAGEQLQQFSKATRLANSEAATNLATSNVSDYSLYQKAIQSNADTINNNSPGNKGPINDTAIAEMNSKTTIKTIMAATEKNPLMGKQLFDDKRYASNLTGEDSGKLLEFIRGRMREYSAPNIANGAIDGTLGLPGQGQVPIERAAQAIRQVESGGNYDSNPINLTSTNSKGQTGHPLGAYGIMTYNLAPWLVKAGMPAMSEDAFIKDHDAQDKLFQAVYGPDMKLHGASGAAMNWLGPSGKDSLGTDRAAYAAKFNKALGDKTPAPEMEALIKAHGDKLGGDEDPLLGDFAVESYRQRMTWQRQAEALQDATTMNTIYSKINQQLQLQKPLTQEALMQDPDYAAAYNTLGNDTKGEKQKLTIQATMRTWANRDTVVTPERTDNFNQLMGEAYADPEGFKKDPFTGVDLNIQQHRDLISLQQDMIQGKYKQDPLLESTLSDPRTVQTLQDMNIQSKKSNPEYTKFVGALREELLLSRAQGKVPTSSDLQDTVTRLTTSRPMVESHGIIPRLTRCRCTQSEPRSNPTSAPRSPRTARLIPPMTRSRTPTPITSISKR